MVFHKHIFYFWGVGGGVGVWVGVCGRRSDRERISRYSLYIIIYKISCSLLQWFTNLRKKQKE